jgi:hypothetical protein
VGAETVPWTGAPGAPQSFGSHVGAVPLHVPFAWQLRVVEPLTL